MFQTFTGSTRRPRQVNLSGRSNTNPFAKTGAGSSSAVAGAQQEREKRQRERERLDGANTIQRIWRGHNARTRVKKEQRHEWDHKERAGKTAQYVSEVEAIAQLRILLHFVNMRDDDDARRLLRCWRQIPVEFKQGQQWPHVLSRTQSTVLAIIDHQIATGRDRELRLETLKLLAAITDDVVDYTSRNVDAFFKTMSNYMSSVCRSSRLPGEKDLLTKIIVKPLQTTSSDSLHAYAAFGCEVLTMPELVEHSHRDMLTYLASNINPRRLAGALSTVLSTNNLTEYSKLTKTEHKVTLLGCFIYIHRESHNLSNRSAFASHQDFVHVISMLLSSIADHVKFDQSSEDDGDDDDHDESNIHVDLFTREQVLSLVNQESIASLLSGNHDRSSLKLEEEAKQLASYALTLLRFFPRRGDEIRMWLYLVSTSSSSADKPRIPAIKYFWQAARSSGVFKTISNDSRAAIKLLQAPDQNAKGWQPPRSETLKQEVTQNEWRVNLIFFELYTFVLKLMDDQEFFSGTSGTMSESATWASRNALPLKDVQELTTFLKNLGFTMYFNATDIASTGRQVDRTDGSLSTYFTVAGNAQYSPQAQLEESKPVEATIAGLTGMGLDYVKGLVTGLLRMIYERDSRRSFLPKDHLLMTSRFDMSAFIPAVVQEEENRHKVQEEDEADIDVEEGSDVDSHPHYVGTGRDVRIRQMDRLQRQQRRASRRRYLQAVAPRLEILQNMPFFIPFETRVQIFREFVHLDQMKRRNGLVEADLWRVAQMHSPSLGRGGEQVTKQHAKIRRNHEFEDAYAHFFALGEGLKEPIQITFVDQFDSLEAGIDGGGVTKEFLTSVTGEVFKPTAGLDLFTENANHLLYPNPRAWEEQRLMLRNEDITESSQPTEFRALMNDLLHRYEFLGRIIGKCLYEGILVNVNFAGFFLLKWALTGGIGSAPKESGYRANLNDLRELDEELYQGLLQLKNYSGDVEDLGLNFTITDTINDYLRNTTTNATHDLRPGGANLPVTNANRLVYISYVARHRLQVEPYRQTMAFLRGLATMIQPSWLSMFNQSELQTLLGGTPGSIDVADLRQNTQYGGVYVIGDDRLEHPTIQLFWAVMESLGEADRRAVLQFVTSTPRAPLLGFASLNPRFSIRDAGDASDGRLPSTSTCVNLLKLPRYRDAGMLRNKLLLAVNSGAGFDLS